MMKKEHKETRKERIKSHTYTRKCEIYRERRWIKNGPRMRLGLSGVDWQHIECR